MVQNVKNARIQVPLTGEMREAYQALADAQRTSLAAVCAEILETAAPTVRELALALETAKKSPTRALREMADVLDQLAAEADQMQIDLDAKIGPKSTRRKYTKKAKTG